MTGKLKKLNLVIIMCFLLAPTIISSQKTADYELVEKRILGMQEDFLTFNYNAFVHSKDKIDIEAEVKIPEEFYRPERYPTIFGLGAVIEAPMIYQLEADVPPPLIRIDGTRVNYEWSFTKEPEKTAIIAYSNYYGEKKVAYSPDSRIGNLQFNQHWTTKKGVLHLDFELVNNGEVTIEGLSILFALPEKKLEFFGRERIEEEILNFTEIKTSEGIAAIEGFFDPSQNVVGVSVMLENNTITLNPGDKVAYSLDAPFDVINAGELRPFFNIRFSQNVEESAIGFKINYNPLPTKVSRIDVYQLSIPGPAFKVTENTLGIGEK